MTNAMITRAVAELSKCTDWLEVHGKLGHIGELGWPDNIMGDAAQWNQMGEAWYSHADTHNLDVHYWALGQWQSTANKILPYRRVSGVWTVYPQAAVIENHPQPPGGSPAYIRGINVDGGYWGYSNTAATTALSNVNIGTYNASGNWHYDDIQAPVDTYAFLATRGVKSVRVGFRWERIQQTLGGALDSAEAGRVDSVISVAAANGIKVVIDPHNWGAYYLYNASTGLGERKRIGVSGEISDAQFADLWLKLSQRYKTNANVVAYDLMNEPISVNGAANWEVSCQAAVDAIRGNADTKLIYIPTYNWSHPETIWNQHPTPWIVDASNNHRYTFHQYFGRNLDSSISQVFDAEAAYWEGRGYAPFKGRYEPLRSDRMGVAPFYVVGRGHRENLVTTLAKRHTISGGTSITPRGRAIRVASTSTAAANILLQPIRASNFRMTIIHRLVRGLHTEVFFREVDTSNRWSVNTTKDETLELWKNVAGVFTRTDLVTNLNGTAQTYQLTITCKGPTIEVSLQGRVIITRTDAAHQTGQIMRWQVYDPTAGRAIADLEYIDIEPL